MDSKGIAHKIDAKERTADVRLKELAPFSKMLLSEPVRKGLHAAGFMYPTVIQATAIPVGKSGMDLLVQSKSGTGKTLIFSVIVLEFYQSDIRDPQSLIVAPTREIAVQIEEVLNEIGKYCTRFRAVCVIGGMDVAEDRKRLQGAKCVVGTPGRILHLIQNEVLNTSQVAVLVLDEADKMYTHTFRQDLQRIRKALPSRKQTIACSATFVDNLDQELAKIMEKPLLISTESRATVLVGIKQFVYELPEQKTSILEMQLKLEALRHIFGRISFRQCLIFAGSQSRADSYRNYLEKEGWPCELISGAQNQKTRLENFRKFREFKTRILMATDLMARGVDSEHVNLVINLELPSDVVTYLHRIGRAGRFGSHGLAISFVASAKDHKTFRKLATNVGSGMKVFKFPLKDHLEKEPRDVWNFEDFEEDAKYYGAYQTDVEKILAPLASQDNVTLTSSLSDSKENLTNNISSNQDSSIDTNTFLVNSKDSALQVPNLSIEQLNAQQILVMPLENDNVVAEFPPLASPPPPPNPSENRNPIGESNNTSSNHLLTSNTIDDASSIAADSLRSSQQDISRYQSILMQKSAIPTLVEFLVDRHSSQDSQTKDNAEPCTKIDLFDAYTKEVLNSNNDSVTESAVTLGEPKLSSNKILQLKSLLIDKPEKKFPINDLKDPYSDFANFQEEDISTSVSEDIDKQTFILSVATPSIQQDSFSELQNNSSDLYPATDETNISTETPREGEEQKHFPSPAHNQVPNLPKFMPDILSGSQHKNKHDQQQHQKLQPKLSINKTAQIEIPPYQSPPNSRSPIVIALDNIENNDSSTDDATTPQAENLLNSGSEIERSGNTSGFDEKTSTSGSSGIESSEHADHQAAKPQQLHVYYTSSEDDSYESDDEEENCEYEEENDESEQYFFDTDEAAEYDDVEDEDEEEVEELHKFHTSNHTNSSNTLTNATPDSLNVVYQSAYARWVDLYWNQMTLVQDYVKFFNFTREQQQNE